MLSVCKGVGGLGCPNSSSIVRSTVPSLAFKNTAPIYASAADDITCLRTVLMMRMAPLLSFLALSVLLTMYENPPARLVASLSDRYDASLCIFHIMSDAW
jgi:hypothetical protein